MITDDILKYTDYKKKQALWIQRENEKRTNMGTNTEQFCIQCYLGYLKIIGYDNIQVLNEIRSIINKIGTYHLSAGDFYNNGYSEEVAKNVDKIMNELI